MCAHAPKSHKFIILHLQLFWDPRDSLKSETAPTLALCDKGIKTQEWQQGNAWTTPHPPLHGCHIGNELQDGQVVHGDKVSRARTIDRCQSLLPRADQRHSFIPKTHRAAFLKGLSTDLGTYTLAEDS